MSQHYRAFMIEKIEVSQFQSLKSVELHLGKFTVIVGPTDVGKSAFIRAIRCAVENPRGDSFIHDKTDCCIVTLHTNGTAVSWQKQRKKGGRYFVNGVSSDHYEAIRLIKLSQIEIGKSVKFYPNFQRQMDSVFLLAESEVVKSRVLGDITNANLILLATSQFKRLSADITYRLAYCRQQVDLLNFQLLRYAGIENSRQCVENLKVFAATLSTSIKYLASLIAIKLKLETAIREVNVQERYYAKLHVLATKLVNSSTPISIKQNFATLAKLIQTKLSADLHIKEAKQYNRISKLFNCLPSIGVSEERIKDLTSLNAYVVSVNKLKLEISTGQTQLDALDIELTQASAVLDDFMLTSKVCPLCEGVMAQ